MLCGAVSDSGWVHANRSCPWYQNIPTRRALDFSRNSRSPARNVFGRYSVRRSGQVYEPGVSTRRSFS